MVSSLQCRKAYIPGFDLIGEAVGGHGFDVDHSYGTCNYVRCDTPFSTRLCTLDGIYSAQSTT